MDGDLPDDRTQHESDSSGKGDQPRRDFGLHGEENNSIHELCHEQIVAHQRKYLRILNESQLKM